MISRHGRGNRQQRRKDIGPGQSGTVSGANTFHRRLDRSRRHIGLPRALERHGAGLLRIAGGLRARRRGRDLGAGGIRRERSFCRRRRLHPPLAPERRPQLHGEREPPHGDDPERRRAHRRDGQRPGDRLPGGSPRRMELRRGEPHALVTGAGPFTLSGVNGVGGVRVVVSSGVRPNRSSSRT